MTPPPSTENSLGPAPAADLDAHSDAAPRLATHLATRAVHAGVRPDPGTGALLTPLFLSSTFAQRVTGELDPHGGLAFEHRGHTYSRASNPTVEALEQRLAALEAAHPGDGTRAVCTASGMAAVSVLALAELRAGARLAVGRTVYGGTVRFAREVLEPLGVAVDFVDPTDDAALDATLARGPAWLLVESPTNPTLELCDLAAAARRCRAAGVRLAVDNTLLTAGLQRPLDLGADLSLLSTTKLCEGHNATLGGALVTRDADLDARLRHLRKTLGCNQSPLEAWLTLRGLETLPLRLERQGASAADLARRLDAHPGVRAVRFPGLPGHPQHDLAARQQAGPGSLLALELHGGLEAARRFLAALELVTPAENLGAGQTLVTHPRSMTHGDVPEDQRRAAGIHDGLLRLSVGLEDPRDLWLDLERGLRAAAGAPAPEGAAR